MKLILFHTDANTIYYHRIAFPTIWNETEDGRSEEEIRDEIRGELLGITPVDYTGNIRMKMA